ncbi:MAG: MAPEG family protein [Pseudomonadota bacterium]
MAAMEVVALYAGVNIFIILVLSIRIVSVRASRKISLGTGGDPEMEVRVRSQANATEYVPAGILGLLLLALLNAPVWLLHALGGSFTLGRLIHPLGMAGPIIGRQLGTIFTWTALAGFVGALFWYALT